MSRISIYPAKAYCVYLHRTGETVFYVGKGRPYRPFESSRRNRSWTDLVSTLETYDVEIVLWTNDNAEAAKEEARLIRLWKPSCNQMMNGYTNEIQRLAASRTHAGKVLSIETRQKISDARTGQPVSLKARQKIADALKGRPSPLKGQRISLEARQKISQARKGRIPNGWQGRQHTETTKQLMRQGKPGMSIRCLETGQVFPSINEAARALGISKSGLRLHLKGRNRHASGYTFEKAA
jgi:hypothetical protein